MTAPATAAQLREQASAASARALKLLLEADAAEVTETLTAARDKARTALQQARAQDPRLADALTRARAARETADGRSAEAAAYVAEVEEHELAGALSVGPAEQARRMMALEAARNVAGRAQLAAQSAAADERRAARAVAQAATAVAPLAEALERAEAALASPGHVALSQHTAEHAAIQLVRDSDGLDVEDLALVRHIAGLLSYKAGQLSPRREAPGPPRPVMVRSPGGGVMAAAGIPVASR